MLDLQTCGVAPVLESTTLYTVVLFTPIKIAVHRHVALNEGAGFVMLVMNKKCAN